MLIRKSSAMKSTTTTTTTTTTTSTVDKTMTKTKKDDLHPPSEPAFRLVELLVVERQRSVPEEEEALGEAGRLRELRRLRALGAHAAAEQDMRALQALPDWRERLRWRAEERSAAERNAKAGALQRSVERLRRAEEQRVRAAEERLARQEELLRRLVAALLEEEEGGGDHRNAAAVQLHRIL